MAVDSADLPMLSTTTVSRLNEQATLKLAEITRTSNTDRSAAERLAVKELLDKSSQRRQR